MTVVIALAAGLKSKQVKVGSVQQLNMHLWMSVFSEYNGFYIALFTYDKTIMLLTVSQMHSICVKIKNESNYLRTN